MAYPTIEQVMKGECPMMLWHYVGAASVSPYKVSEDKLKLASMAMTIKDAKIMMSHGMAVICTAMIINKMMERPINYGCDLPDMEGK